MRAFVMIVVALGLAACTPAVPDSGRGVGFKNYSTYLKEKTQAAEAAAAAEAQLRVQTASKASARAAAEADAAAKARAREEVKASAKAEAEARAAARAAGRSAAQAEAEGRAAARASAKAAAKAEARYAAEAAAAARAAAKIDARSAADAEARYAAEAEARYAEEARAAAAAGSAEPLNGFSPDSAAAAIDRADGLAPEPFAPEPIVEQPQSDTRARGNAPEGIKQESGEMEYATEGVSDEQDFGAVSARETIESDKARIAKNRATYTVDQPEALPQRSGGSGPSIVEFALATSHPPGAAMYRRSSLRITSAERACSRYASPDLAQEAFLASGGPDRDRKGLDPDGDGYACSWDPRPFRTALQ